MKLLKGLVAIPLLVRELRGIRLALERLAAHAERVPPESSAKGMELLDQTDADMHLLEVLAKRNREPQDVGFE